MQVYEAAKKLNITTKELVKLIDSPDIVHHKARIPDSILNDIGLGENTQTIDSAETEIVDVEIIEECQYSINEIKLGIRCLGSNAPQYKWRHLIG